MPGSRFCFSLHSCQVNDGLLSGTSSKLSSCCCCQALSQQNTKHRTLPGASAACPPPGAFLLLCIPSPPHAMSHGNHSHAIGGSGGSLGNFAMLSVSNTSGIPCPGHRGHHSIFLPSTPVPVQLGVLGPYLGRTFPRLLGLSLEGHTGNLQCKRFRQMEKKG